MRIGFDVNRTELDLVNDAHRIERADVFTDYTALISLDLIRQVYRDRVYGTLVGDRGRTTGQTSTNPILVDIAVSHVVRVDPETRGRAHNILACGERLGVCRTESVQTYGDPFPEELDLHLSVRIGFDVNRTELGLIKSLFAECDLLDIRGRPCLRCPVIQRDGNCLCVCFESQQTQGRKQ